MPLPHAVAPGERRELALAPGVRATVFCGTRPGPTVWLWVADANAAPAMAQALGEVRDRLSPATLRGTLGLLLDGPASPHRREQPRQTPLVSSLCAGAAAVVLLGAPPAPFVAAPHVEVDVDDRAARRVARALGAAWVAPWTARLDPLMVAAPLARWLDGERERISRAVTDRASAAVRSLLVTLAMIEGERQRPPVRVVLRAVAAVEALGAGVAEPVVEPGELVRAGQLVAWFGEPGLTTRHAVVAPTTGVVLRLRAGRMNGGAIATVGKLRRSLPKVVRTQGERRPTTHIELGWCEWARLPELGVDVKAKIDTGARTSALHVTALRPVDGADGLYNLDIPSGRRGRTVTARVEVVDSTMVRDSGGHLERRPVISTLLSLGGIERQVRVSLTDRGDMLFPMLVGRTALGPELRVVPSARWLLGRKRRS